MSDPTMAFFCEGCGGGVDTDQASPAEWQRAEAGDPTCDSCFAGDRPAADAGQAEVDVEQLRRHWESTPPDDCQCDYAGEALELLDAYQGQAGRIARLVAQVGAQDKLLEWAGAIVAVAVGVLFDQRGTDSKQYQNAVSLQEVLTEHLANPDAAAEAIARRNAALDAFFEAVTDTGHAEIVCDMEDYGREPGDIVTVDVGLGPRGFASGEFSAELVLLARAATAEGGNEHGH